MKRMLLLLAACSSKPATRETPHDAAAAMPRAARDARVAAPDAALAGQAIEQLGGFRAIADAMPAKPDELDAIASLPAAKGCPTDNGLMVGDGGVAFLISLAHGVVLEPALTTASTPPDDCEGSADDLEGAWMGQVLPDADPELVVVHERGGKNAGEYDLEIWKVVAGAPKRILSTPIETYEGTSHATAHAELAPDGTIHIQRGEVTEVWALGPDGTFAKR